MTDITSVEIYLRTFYRFEKNLENIDSRFARGQFFLKKDKNNLFFSEDMLKTTTHILLEATKYRGEGLSLTLKHFFFFQSVNQDVFSSKLNIFGCKPQMVNFAFCFDFRILQKSVPR